MLTLKTPCAPKQSFPTLHALKPVIQYLLEFETLKWEEYIVSSNGDNFRFKIFFVFTTYEALIPDTI